MRTKLPSDQVQGTSIEYPLVRVPGVHAVCPDVQNQFAEEQDERSDPEEEEQGRNEEEFVRGIVAQSDEGLAMSVPVASMVDRWCGW